MTDQAERMAAAMAAFDRILGARRQALRVCEKALAAFPAIWLEVAGTGVVVNAGNEVEVEFVQYLMRQRDGHMDTIAVLEVERLVLFGVPAEVPEEA